MRHFLFSTLIMLFSISVSAQSDQIFLHNGQEISGKVLKVAEHTVTFTYDGEDAEQTLGKYAVQKVVYGKSGREQVVSDRIDISGKDGWQNVIIIESLEEVAGLKRVGEIKGKTGFINYRTGAGSDRKAQEKLQKEAAAANCPFVLLTMDKDIDRKGASGGGFGQNQSIKKGVGYSY
ncbi:MAG: hypothetical protein WBA59_00205 [Moheibacter sp.]